MAFQTSTSASRARNLRKNDTEAERRLWEAIRNRRLAGFKFVRQLPIGPYVADFACRESKLILEVDGAPMAQKPSCATMKSEQLSCKQKVFV